MKPVLAGLLALTLAIPAAAATPPDQEGQARERSLSGGPGERRGGPVLTIDAQTIVPGARRLTESYGSSPDQTFDVYTPPDARRAPVLIMVHGGAWRIGDKASPGVVENKLRYWLPRGYILVSVNYRLLPEATAYEQATDVAEAVRQIADRASAWGGDPGAMILMGHSAGGHIAALLAARPEMVGRPLAGAVILDTAVLDVEAVLTRRHPRLYDEAFGADPDDWHRASPSRQWTPAATPMLVVCSTRRPDHPCEEAGAFARMTAGAGRRTVTLPVDLTHREVNDTLGLAGDYTRTVDDFIVERLAGSAR